MNWKIPHLAGVPRPLAAALFALGLSFPSAPASAQIDPPAERQLAADSSDVVVVARTRWPDPQTRVVTEYAVRIDSRPGDDPASGALPSWLPEDAGERPAVAGYEVRNPALAPMVFKTLPPDSPFHGADQEQIAYWNLYVQDLFQVAESSEPGWGQRNGVSEIAGFPTDEELRRETGEGWSRGAFSMSTSFIQDGHIVETDIMLNPAYEWTLDEAAATQRFREVYSFRAAILRHLGAAWGYHGLMSFGGIFRGEIVSRDSLFNFKSPEISFPVLFAEDAAAARAYYPAKRIRDGLVSAYRVVPGPGFPFYNPVTPSVSTMRPGGSFEIRSQVTLENPGTEPLVQPNLEVYLVPRRFSLDRAILVKRHRVRATLQPGESLAVGLGRVTLPRNARPGTYYLAFVLRDPQDAYQGNNRTWGTESAAVTVRR